MSNVFGSRAAITPISYGETKPVAEGDTFADYQKNRRVEVVPEGNVFTEGFRMLPGDAYVLDASGSMNERSNVAGKSKWQLVREYDFPACADLYVFNSCEGLEDVDAADEVKPDCGTPLWSSVLDVLDAGKGYKRITVLTDGEDTDRGVGIEEVIAKAKAEGIAVSMIGTGIYDNGVKDSLVQVADQTGGGFYIKGTVEERK